MCILREIEYACGHRALELVNRPGDPIPESCAQGLQLEEFEVRNASDCPTGGSVLVPCRTFQNLSLDQQRIHRICERRVHVIIDMFDNSCGRLHKLEHEMSVGRVVDVLEKKCGVMEALCGALRACGEAVAQEVDLRAIQELAKKPIDVARECIAPVEEWRMNVLPELGKLAEKLEGEVHELRRLQPEAKTSKRI